MEQNCGSNAFVKIDTNQKGNLFNSHLECFLVMFQHENSSADAFLYSSERESCYFIIYPFFA